VAFSGLRCTCTAYRVLMSVHARPGGRRRGGLVDGGAARRRCMRAIYRAAGCGGARQPDRRVGGRGVALCGGRPEV
jgi:hypothetical protein